MIKFEDYGQCAYRGWDIKFVYQTTFTTVQHSPTFSWSYISLRFALTFGLSISPSPRYPSFFLLPFTCNSFQSIPVMASPKDDKKSQQNENHVSACGTPTDPEGSDLVYNKLWWQCLSFTWLRPQRKLNTNTNW